MTPISGNDTTDSHSNVLKTEVEKALKINFVESF